MKSMLIRPIVSSALAATLLSLSVQTIVRAQTPDGDQMVDSAFGRPRGPARLLGPLFPILRRLNLPPDERSQIRQIVQAHRADFQMLIRRATEARRALFEAVFLDRFDEAVIRDRSAATAAVEADEAVLRATVRTEIFAVLTPEEQARATEALKAFERRRLEPTDLPLER
jgi:Spy/CpxP family protein refolding chaperone